MIGIIDYKLGNVKSVSNMINKIGYKCIISSDTADLKDCKKFILPGVGAFDSGMENLENLGLVDFLFERVKKDKLPILGICLGMQLMTKRSDEGEKGGLSLINAEVKNFKNNIDDNIYKVPHMGWNKIKIVSNSLLIDDNMKKSKFYFVHSFYVKCNNNKIIKAKTDYGIEFCSIFNHQNIYGVQFHPEKSHKYGMQLLDNFINKC